MTWPDGPVRFVDTAGFRRPCKVQGVEYYSFLRAERAIERAHVALLVLDASQGFTGEDKRIAARVMEVGRGLDNLAFTLSEHCCCCRLFFQLSCLSLVMRVQVANEC